jgi:hypothetical protein
LDFGFLGGRDDGVERGAFHARHEFHDSGFANVHDEAVDDLVAEVAMGHLAALEAEAGFDLVAVVEEANGLVLLGHVVVFVYVDGELYFLDDDDLLLLAGSAIALVFFVEVFAVVLDFADGRDGVGRDLDEVEGAFAGHLQCVEGRHDAELFAVLVDHADFACADTLVGADKRLGGTFIDRWDSQPPWPASAAMRLEKMLCFCGKAAETEALASIAGEQGGSGL